VVFFNVVLYYLDDKILSRVWQLADDVKMVGCVRSDKRVDNLKEGIGRIGVWADIWSTRHD